jgi:hypothetical protein
VERIRLKLTPVEDAQADEPDDKQVMEAELSLRIERNSKFVGGMKHSRESIEMFILTLGIPIDCRVQTLSVTSTWLAQPVATCMSITSLLARILGTKCSWVA